MDQYDFDSFLSCVENLDLASIIRYADEEARRAEAAMAGGRRGAPAARAAGAGRYASDLKSLLNYLDQRGRSKPGSLTDYQFRGLRNLCENLVARGEFKPEALSLFESCK
jgi:hypothetical protein